MSGKYEIINVARQRWYAVENNSIGGWSIANVNKKVADINVAEGDREIGCFISQELAEHIVLLHNKYLAHNHWKS